MASPRELAEKAITALQDALRDSEHRVTELDTELKRKRAPKNRLEEQIEVLTHRLESVEADALHWQREAGHLEEVLENERAKIQSLKKKLELAESGPDRLDKKEVNFWRQRAEMFDAETREYKNRIASLRKELAEGRPAETGDPYVAMEENDKLGAKLTEAEAEIEQLRTRLAAQDDQIASLLEELEALRDERQQAAQDGEAMQAESESLRQQLEELQRTLDDAQADKNSLSERIAALEAERNEVREIADQASQRLKNAINERDSRVAAISAELAQTRAELETRTEERAALDCELEQARADAAEQQQKAEQLAAELERTHRGAETERKAVEAAEQRVADLDAELRQASEQIAATETEIAERDRRIEALSAELEDTRAISEEHEQALVNLRELTTVEKAQLQQRNQQLETELSDALGRGDESTLKELERELQDARERIAGLEAELKEEKECTENLSELANERRETLIQVEEKLEEAEERYEEAKWRLGKAEHFERLVRRRKGLIDSLIATIRAKNKANKALKAGLDGLRRYKATAEASQHKLVARVDQLGTALAAAREELKTRKADLSETPSEELEAARVKIAQLEERLGMQAELMQNLETELEAAKAKQQSAGDDAAKMATLEQALAAKDEVIGKLQADIDEQQRRLAKLRGSESETMRLQTLADQDKGTIDSLQREVAQLRQALVRKDAADGTNDGELVDQLKERDSSIARLMGTVKEQEAKIAELTELVQKWKRKYEFVSAEAPSAYQSVAEK